ncbi:MAG: hypothetical protein RIB64_00225 [Arenibacter algicola]
MRLGFKNENNNINRRWLHKEIIAETASLPKYDSIKNAKKKAFPIEGDRIRKSDRRNGINSRSDLPQHPAYGSVLGASLSFDTNLSILV